MSSNAVDLRPVKRNAVRALVYQNFGSPVSSSTVPGGGELSAREASFQRAEVEMTRNELAERLCTERSEAAHQAEQALIHDYEQKIQTERGKIAAAISTFEAQQEQYFAQAEAEVVQLALAIAAKILHREVQVDPMLMATLVRIAVEKLRDGSRVTVRVCIGAEKRWRAILAESARRTQMEVVGDASLGEHDCLLETELGVADLGLEAQLKELEQGFFDLMALRPVKS